MQNPTLALGYRQNRGCKKADFPWGEPWHHLHYLGGGSSAHSADPRGYSYITLLPSLTSVGSHIATDTHTHSYKHMFTAFTCPVWMFGANLRTQWIQIQKFMCVCVIYITHNILQPHSWKEKCTTEHTPHPIPTWTQFRDDSGWSAHHSNPHTSSTSRRAGLSFTINTDWQNVLKNIW